MIWGIWGERAGAPSTVNRRRISTHGYCGKQCADIIANSVTLCKISSCGYFCGNFAGIGDISDILTVWYFDQSPVNCPGVSWCGLGPPPFFFLLLLFVPLLFLLFLLFLHYYFMFTHCILLSMSISLNWDVSLIITDIICTLYCFPAHLRCCHPKCDLWGMLPIFTSY